MKIVTQLDRNGFANGTTTADESPLEPGVFLIPGGCVDALVEIPEGKRAFWNGKKFELQDVPKPEPKPEPQLEPPLTPEQQAARVTAARAAAYAAESDALFFKSQRGEATKEEWLAKVQEIKDRFPKP